MGLDEKRAPVARIPHHGSDGGSDKTEFRCRLKKKTISKEKKTKNAKESYMPKMPHELTLYALTNTNKA